MAATCNGKDGTAEAATSRAVTGTDRASNTEFNFTHKMFNIPGAKFILAPDSREPVLNIQLGDLSANLSFRSLLGSFDFSEHGHDVDLLRLVEQGLKFVKVIRPGEAIPRELLDGSASWSVEERHLLVARGRLCLQLVSWLSNTPSPELDLLQLEQLVAKPETKVRVQDAFTEMARELGVPAERRQDLIDQVDKLAQELSYIEALRDRFGKIREIGKALNRLNQVYRGENEIQGEILRVRALIKKPVQALEARFQGVDANTGEILNTLKTYKAQIPFIRATRDQLHLLLREWDGVILAWRDIAFDRSIEAELAIKQTYRFAASNFLEARVWRR
ncbi:MAG: hypothetical protein GC191_08600 [Azospirillum sp.]|nr:hypothetical protein [Azospirillum sp.]